MKYFITFCLLFFSVFVSAQFGKPPKQKHSKENCTKTMCKKKHVIQFVEEDTLTGKETRVTRIFSGYKNDGPKKYKTIEKTFDYKGDLLKLHVRERTPKGISYEIITYNSDGTLKEKRIGKPNKKITKEYKAGELVRHTVLHDREVTVKKDLTRR